LCSRGNEHRLLTEAAEKRITLITSEDVLDEVIKVLKRKFPEYNRLVVEFLKLIQIQVILKQDYEKNIETDVVRDSADAHVLAAAVSSKSSVIVTGDRDLLVIEEYQNIHIKTTTQILKELG